MTPPTAPPTVLDPGAAIKGRGRNMVAGDFTPAFELAMARKDVRLMQETAGERPLAALPGIAGRMDALITEGRGGDDLAVLGRDAAGHAGRVAFGADILSTAIAPTWTQIGKLGAVAVIRTALNYFLGKEMREEAGRAVLRDATEQREQPADRGAARGA